MKILFSILGFLFVINFSFAQIVDIPDADFKDVLLNYTPTIDTNNDGEIQVTEAEAVLELTLTTSGINVTSIEGLEAFVNLVDLTLGYIAYDVDNLIIENLPDLESVHVYGFNASSMSLVNLPSLNMLEISGNQNENFTNVDFSSCNCNNLEFLALSETFYISSLEISDFVNLKNLHLNALVYLEQLDILSNTNLEHFSLTATEISELDLSNQSNLESLNVYWQGLTYLDVTNSPSLNDLQVDSANLEHLDLSQNPNLNTLYLGDITADWINLKNGNTPAQWFSTSSYLNVDYICADESDIEILENRNFIHNPVINSYCSFNPGGEFYTIEGENRVDANTNGCDAGDNFYPSLKFNITDGTNSGTYIANNSGSYTIPVSEGTHTMATVLENSDYFTVSPSSVSISFPTASSPYNQDFCITPNGVHDDLEVVVIPTTEAIPGFDTEYKIIYKNKGNTTLGGTIDLNFEDDYMDFLSASPTEDILNIGNLQWNYTNLQPFETREIFATFNLNTPTDPNFPLNSDDILDFDVSISPNANDETPGDNSFGLKQTVVNSYDPNDIRCIEGNTITPEQVGDYVHYIIRFENLGTANATNVVVKDVIDNAKFDVSSLIPLNASHNFTTRVRESNIVEFIFENIQLPFDDANNDGYVVFKIKTLDTLALGDTFENEAEIYFDFNFPVITNIYSTAVQDNLSVDDVNTSEFSVYPNPVKDFVTIASQVDLDIINIRDINGRLIKTFSSTTQDFQNQLDVSALTSGLYFMEIKSGVSQQTFKFIKE